MPFKFEKLEVWRLAMDYIDLNYELGEQLPKNEAYNLKSQMTSQIARAATSVALNIAEGSTGQTGAQQARFLGLAIHSVLETVACQHIISRRKFLRDMTDLHQAYRQAEKLAAKLHTMRRRIVPGQSWLREDPLVYVTNDESNATA